MSIRDVSGFTHTPLQQNQAVTAPQQAPRQAPQQTPAENPITRPRARQATPPQASLLDDQSLNQLEAALDQAPAARLEKAAARPIKPQRLRAASQAQTETVQATESVKQVAPISTGQMRDLVHERIDATRQRPLGTGEAGILIEAGLGKEFNNLDWTYLFKQQANIRAENKAAAWVGQMLPDHPMLLTLAKRTDAEMRESLAFAAGFHLNRFQGLSYAELPEKHRQGIDAMLRGLRRGQTAQDATQSSIQPPPLLAPEAEEAVRDGLAYAPSERPSRLATPEYLAGFLKTLDPQALLRQPEKTLLTALAGHPESGKLLRTLAVTSVDEYHSLLSQAPSLAKASGLQEWEAGKKIYDLKFKQKEAEREALEPFKLMIKEQDAQIKALGVTKAAREKARPLREKRNADQAIYEKREEKLKQMGETLYKMRVSLEAKEKLIDQPIKGLIHAAISQVCKQLNTEVQADGLHHDGTVYQIGKEIGAGGNGLVNHLTSATASPNKLVLKQMTSQVNKLGPFQAELRSFLEFSHERSHPNLQKLKGIYFQPEKPAYGLVTEFAHFGSLDNWKQTLIHAENQQLISPGTRELLLRATLARTLEGMACLQKDHHMLHRDLKPDNILIHADGHPEIADLGTVKLGQKIQVRELTGTEGYLAPENYLPGESRSLDYKNDIWAMGVVLLEVLADRPKPKNVGSEQMAAFGQDPSNRIFYTEPKAVNPSQQIGYAVEHIGPLEDMINAMMHPQPQHRPTLETIAAQPYFSNPILAAHELEAIPKLLAQPQSPERDRQLQMLDRQISQRTGVS